MQRLGILRVDKEVEVVGLDMAELGGMTQELYSKLKVEYGQYLGDEAKAKQKGLELDLEPERDVNLNRSTGK